MSWQSKGSSRGPTKYGPLRPPSADRPRPPDRPTGRSSRPARAGAARDLDRGSAVRGRGGGGAGDGPAHSVQSSVKDMIRRLDGSRSGERHASPSKRLRTESQSDAASSSSGDATASQPLTEETLRSVMRRMTQKIRDDIAAQFVSLKEELGRMGARINELEQHVEQRDRYIDEVEQRLHSRESRVAELEEEVDQLVTANRRNVLIFSGSAVPAPPSRPWTEDVTATAVAMLSRCLPGVPVAREDIAESHRVARGRRIVCRFRVAGKDSVREKNLRESFQSPPAGTERLCA